VADPDDVAALALHLGELAYEAETRQMLGENGRREVEAFDRGKVLSDWRERIQRLVKGNGKRT
jgi:glycosyltransferase involved in cell wall biosynthesis